MSATATEIDVVPVAFVGKRWAFFRLTFRMTLVTLLTLGLGRFWMKTAQRRYLWSAVKPMGITLEYHGGAGEKLMGFLLAVCVLAFYIAIVNLFLIFLTFTLFKTSAYFLLISFVGILPVFWVAKYRARQYLLARTSWRGIRFHANPVAWRYAGAAAWNWFLTVITLGILWPRMTWKMEKFRTENTFYGDTQFHQGGDWRDVRVWMRPYYFVLPFFLVMFVTFANVAFYNPFLWIMYGTYYRIGTFVSLLLIFFAMAWYRAGAMKALWNSKTIGDLPLTSRIRPMRIVRHYFLGWFMIIATFALAIFVLVKADEGLNLGILAGIEALDFTTEVDRDTWIAIGVGIFLYFMGFILMGVLIQTWITYPNIRHMVETTALPSSDFAHVAQSKTFGVANAEGLADALDLGAAF